jgi:hypothetical protein
MTQTSNQPWSDFQSDEARLTISRGQTYYDPPGGDRHGFPKAYNPIPGETLEDTLIRDGYPERDAINYASYCRFWKKEDA